MKTDHINSNNNECYKIPNMHNIIFAIITLIIIATVSYAENQVEGHWEGQINVPNQPLTIKIDLSLKDSNWTGTIDIPAQAAKGLTLTGFKIEEVDKIVNVKFSIKGIPGNPTFDGHLKDGIISGKLTQGGAVLDFELSRELVADPLRPQEPIPPFPYTIEEVIFQNGQIKLAGTLTLPQGEAPFPAALLISGSGLQDRDETIFGHKPFWVIADYLTRAGIAVLRVDDPGIGKSTPHPNSPTTLDFATDVEASVAFLKKDDRIGQVGLIGHSEGGAIAAIVASRNDDISFVVLMAAPGVLGSELLYKQNERILDAMGMETERKQELLSLLDQLFKTLTLNIADDELRKQIVEIARKQFEVNGISEDMLDETQVNAAVQQVLNPWMRYFLDFNPQLVLRDVKSPVLALNGELDVQVDAEQNLTGIISALKQGGNPNLTIHRFPKLNHLFQHATTGLVNEYAMIEETISPEVLELIRDWVLSVVQ